MPNMDGITLVTKIREISKTVPIIMCTTEAEKSRVLEAIKASVNNYIVFTNNDGCLQASTAMTIEMRIKPYGLEGTGTYIRRILARDSNQNYQVSVWRNNSWSTYNAPPDTASIAFWLSPVDKRGGQWWKVVLTDYTQYPIVSSHWYKVKVVWNSAKPGGIPCDIFVDDQGPNGSDVGENWSGYANATNLDQSLVPTDRRVSQGDVITAGDGNFAIGCNVNNYGNDAFYGLIDWLTWEAAARY